MPRQQQLIQDCGVPVLDRTAAHPPEPALAPYSQIPCPLPLLSQSVPPTPTLASRSSPLLKHVTTPVLLEPYALLCCPLGLAPCGNSICYTTAWVFIYSTPMTCVLWLVYMSVSKIWVCPNQWLTSRLRHHVPWDSLENVLRFDEIST